MLNSNTNTNVLPLLMFVNMSVILLLCPTNTVVLVLEVLKYFCLSFYIITAVRIQQQQLNYNLRFTNNMHRCVSYHYELLLYNIMRVHELSSSALIISYSNI
jgi:hypothetical protein